MANTVDTDQQRRDLDFAGFKGRNVQAAVDPGDVPRFDQITGTEFSTLSRESAKTLLGVVETIEDEFNFDFSKFSAASITAALAALVADLAGAGTGTVRLYVGSTTPGTLGTLRATVTNNTVAYALKKNTGASFATPAGADGNLVQVTHEGSGALVNTASRGVSIALQGA